MIDLTKIITSYNNFVKEEVKNKSVNQRIDIACTLAHFFLGLPDSDNCLTEYLKTSISEKQIINDIQNSNTEFYLDLFKKADESIDPYSDDFIELEQIEICILDGIHFCVGKMDKHNNLAIAFMTIINLLDYCEGCSEEPEFWNDLIEKEINFQKSFLTQKEKVIDQYVYVDRYKQVNFNNLH